MIGKIRRDPVTKAIINNDEKEYREYQWKIYLISQIKEQKKTIEKLNERVEALEYMFKEGK